MTTASASRSALDSLLALAGLPIGLAAGATLPGEDPVQPSSFRIGALAQASIAAGAVAAAEIARQRGQKVAPLVIPMRHAAAEFRSERHLRVDGAAPPDPWDPTAGLYRCGDGGHVRLHTNFPHHRDGVLRLLGGLPPERAAIAQALQSWAALEFEAAAAEAGLCVAALRSFAEWDAHPQGAALAGQPPLILEKIGEAPPEPLPPGGDSPLQGLRLLEMTRIIAGPAGGRSLAAHGADVLLLTAPHLPGIPTLEIDTGRGKRQAQLDLRQPQDAARLDALLSQADLFLQSYRPGALSGRGFSAEEAVARRPGLICLSLSAYGHLGPWRDRRGFDSLVQTATGFNQAEAEAAGTPDKPRVLPCQALDHASGHLLAFGAMAALLRRAQEGGSWRVRVSLAATGLWLRSLGRVGDGFSCAEDEVSDLLEESDSGFGRLIAVRPAAGRLRRPAMPKGSHPPAW